MARLKRSSSALQKAEQREAGLQSISSTLDLGNERRGLWINKVPMTLEQQ